MHVVQGLRPVGGLCFHGHHGTFIEQNTIDGQPLGVFRPAHHDSFFGNKVVHGRACQPLADDAAAQHNFMRQQDMDQLVRQETHLVSDFFFRATNKRMTEQEKVEQDEEKKLHSPHHSISVPTRKHDAFYNNKDEIDKLTHELQKSKRKMVSFKDKSFLHDIRRVLSFLELSPSQKAIIVDRYVKLLDKYKNKKKKYTRIYGWIRGISQFCSIVTPALVSIQPVTTDAKTTENPIYWAAWGTSFLLGIMTGYINLFRLDKKYFTFTESYLRLESEGWNYFCLCGRYAKQDLEAEEPTHASRFRMFCQEIENIRQSAFSTTMKSNDSNSSTPKMTVRK